jgi:preprotein translocase subunit SecB
MSQESENPQPADAEQQAAPPIVINGQYIKDLSFEAPAAPGVFAELQQGAPEIAINVDVNAQPLQNNNFEVALHIRAECKTGETTAFLLEVAYGGLFTLTVPQEHLQPVLLIECPRLLFPFVRHLMAVVTREGGFPPLLLGPVDFVAMYQANLKSEAEASGQSPTEG